MEEKCLPHEEDDNKEEKAKKAEAAAGKPAWEVVAAVLLALVLFFSIKGDGDFKVRRPTRELQLAPKG